jgi:hypothetical protein
MHIEHLHGGKLIELRRVQSRSGGAPNRKTMSAPGHRFERRVLGRLLAKVERQRVSGGEVRRHLIALAPDGSAALRPLSTGPPQLIPNDGASKTPSGERQ